MREGQRQRSWDTTRQKAEGSNTGNKNGVKPEMELRVKRERDYKTEREKERREERNHWGLKADTA